MNWQEAFIQYAKAYGGINVVLSGITCSGKTTLSKRIQKLFQNLYTVAVIHQDDYFKNLPDIPRVREGYLTDSVEAFCTQELIQDVHTLLQEKVVMMPRYDVASNTRICKNKIVRAGKVNIFEGLHTISLLQGLPNSIYLFVDTNPAICLARRIARDTVAYGVPEARIRQYWKECITPMCERDIFPQKDFANLVVDSKGGEFYVVRTNL